LLWFNPSWQLSTTQALTHLSHLLPGGMGRRIGKKTPDSWVEVKTVY